MAFHILIEKLTETEGGVTFRFYETAFPNEVGELYLDKKTELVFMTKGSREVFFQRAARKVAVAYTSRSLLELLEWAS